MNEVVNRYREYMNAKGDFPPEGTALQAMKDMGTLADAFAAEHDDTPVDEVWLRSVGFIKWCESGDAIGYYDGNKRLYVLFADAKVRVLMGAEVLLLNASRGQVRTLCRALGITLKEADDGKA